MESKIDEREIRLIRRADGARANANPEVLATWLGYGFEIDGEVHERDRAVVEAHKQKAKVTEPAGEQGKGDEPKRGRKGKSADAEG